VCHINVNCQVHYTVITKLYQQQKNTFYALVIAESINIVKATDLKYP